MDIKNLLKNRFDEDSIDDLDFEQIWERILSSENTLHIIENMEKTGGEPRIGKIKDGIIIFDSYKKIPDKRKSLCYDKRALENRKKNKPKSDIFTEVKKIGSKLMTEEIYYETQKIYSLDENISSWVKTPNEIRKLGGAIFCDKRFGRVFTYHNSAESYYQSRGFRTYILL